MTQKGNNVLDQARQILNKGSIKLAAFWQKTKSAWRRPQKDEEKQPFVVVNRVDQTAAAGQPIRQRSKKRIKPIRRRGRQRVYRLAGYTTVSKINSRRKSESRQRVLRQILLILLVVLAVILLFRLYNPIKDLSEWYRIIGIKELKDLAGIETTTSSGVASQITNKVSQATTG